MMLKKLAKLNALQLILLAFLITGLINILIAYFDISGLSNIRSEQTDIFFPSSKVIGTVWMLLIAGLSYSFSVVAKKDESIAKHLILLFLICVTYPFYTIGFSSLSSMILGNLVTISYGSFIVGLLYTTFKTLSFVVSLIPIWVVFVTFLMFRVYS
jgi:tryptophan-rich sensory protein